ncbi:RDD family protein [Mesonia aquimarina]|uniref:RDD family protein n=1 Tax=Mesonia aquimarina TaxID=1504967 RepID=UPI000EF5A7E6|nr:RDD family protein [Mesonia aquimarina]
MKKIEYPCVFLRVKAAVIDAIVLIILIMITSTVFSDIGEVPVYTKVIVFCFIFLGYEPLMLSIFGATFGHRMMSLKVQQDSKDKKLNIISAFFRFVIKALLGWISLLTISSDKKGKAIHDKAVKSVVILDK